MRFVNIFPPSGNVRAMRNSNMLCCQSACRRHSRLQWRCSFQGISNFAVQISRRKQQPVSLHHLIADRLHRGWAPGAGFAAYPAPVAFAAQLHGQIAVGTPLPAAICKAHTTSTLLTLGLHNCAHSAASLWSLPEAKHGPNMGVCNNTCISRVEPSCCCALCWYSTSSSHTMP